MQAAVASGEVPQSRIDDMVRRMLVPMYALGLMDHFPTGACTTTGSQRARSFARPTFLPAGNIFANATSAAHNALARTLAEQSAVLLQVL